MNSHGLTPTTPSRWRVYRFHHLGMAGAAGLEPTTGGFGDRCSTKLSYAPAISLAQIIANTPGATRTPDTRFRKPLLYPPELQGQSGDRGIRTPNLCDANAALSLLSYIPADPILAIARTKGQVPGPMASPFQCDSHPTTFLQSGKHYRPGRQHPQAERPVPIGDMCHLLSGTRDHTRLDVSESKARTQSLARRYPSSTPSPQKPNSMGDSNHSTAEETQGSLQLSEGHLRSVDNGVRYGRRSEEGMGPVLKRCNLASCHPVLHQSRQYVDNLPHG